MLDSTDHTTSDLRHDMVAFRVADQDFCIDIGMVREIRSWSETTFLPHAQPYVKGVINLRGAVVAVIDLAARLGLGVTKTDPRNVIIIAQVGTQRSDCWRIMSRIFCPCRPRQSNPCPMSPPKRPKPSLRAW